MFGLHMSIACWYGDIMNNHLKRPVCPQAEKKQIARNRGDPKTQTSDARFDERFAVMHGLAGQAPWYARPQQSMYATDTVQSSEGQAAALHAQAGRSSAPHHRRNAGHQSSAGRDAAREQRGAHRHQGDRNGQRRSNDAAQHATFDMAAARSDLAAMVGQSSRAHDACSDPHAKDKDKEKRKLHHKSSHKSKHHGGSESRGGGPTKRQRAERSRSPKASHKRSKSRRRDSSNSDGERVDTGVQAASRSSSPVMQVKSGSTRDKFEHLRRERLERERAEAQRTRSLLQKHFSR